MRTAAVPVNVHSRISAEQGKFWRDQWAAIPDAAKRKLQTPGTPGLPICTIGNVIAATASADRATLLAKMEAMIQAQEKYFSPFWLGKSATVADLNKLAAKLGLNLPNAKIADVVQKITSKSAIETFKDLYQTRMTSIWGIVKGAGGAVKKLADTAKVAGKLGMYAMIINIVVSDLTLAGDPNAPQWVAAHNAFEKAIKTQERRGYPDANEVDQAKQALLDALNGFQSGGDTTAMLRYMLSIKFGLEINELQ